MRDPRKDPQRGDVILNPRQMIRILIGDRDRIVYRAATWPDWKWRPKQNDYLDHWKTWNNERKPTVIFPQGDDDGT